MVSRAQNVVWSAEWCLERRTVSGVQNGVRSTEWCLERKNIRKPNTESAARVAELFRAPNRPCALAAVRSATMRRWRSCLSFALGRHTQYDCESGSPDMRIAMPFVPALSVVTPEVSVLF